MRKMVKINIKRQSTIKGLVLSGNIITVNDAYWRNSDKVIVYLTGCDI